MSGVIPWPARFTPADAERAFAEWGANCGPGAVAAIAHLTLDELRPHLGDFERKGHTNPTLMWSILNSIGATWTMRRQGVTPAYGLARIQWEGPWTKPLVPARVAYRHTHWIGVSARSPSNIGVFDINCMASGGWVSLKEWSERLVPWLLNQCEPGADGKWRVTHAVEITALKGEAPGACPPSGDTP